MSHKILLITFIMGAFNLFGQSKKGNNESEFKFNDPENKAVFTCSHVVQDKNPILYVEHDLDGDWQFLCGQDNHTEQDAKVISLKQATELDNTLNDLFEMPKGIGAQRTAVGEKWKPFRVSAE